MVQFGIYLVYIWCIFGVYLVYIWCIFGIYLDQILSSKFFENCHFLNIFFKIIIFLFKKILNYHFLVHFKNNII